MSVQKCTDNSTLPGQLNRKVHIVILFMKQELLSVPRKHLLKTSHNKKLATLEAFAPELLENLEEMFPLYYMKCNIYLQCVRR